MTRCFRTHRVKLHGMLIYSSESFYKTEVSFVTKHLVQCSSSLVNSCSPDTQTGAQLYSHGNNREPRHCVRQKGKLSNILKVLPQATERFQMCTFLAYCPVSDRQKLRDDLTNIIADVSKLVFNF